MIGLRILLSHSTYRLKERSPVMLAHSNDIDKLSYNGTDISCSLTIPLGLYHNARVSTKHKEIQHFGNVYVYVYTNIVPAQNIRRS